MAWLGRRRAAASAAAVALAASGLLVLAWLRPGFAIADVDLNDSGVWVSKPVGQLLGRMNVDAGDLDGSLFTESSDFDVAQDG
ncbi:MAG: hypothetical protein LBG60_08500, partial [Bifidobacteriaceae bacterium]|nr:hypothetical protein [Bifidobacteriaceae bacterium]